MKVCSLMLLGAACLVFMFPAGKGQYQRRQDLKEAHNVKRYIRAKHDYPYGQVMNTRQSTGTSTSGVSVGVGDKDNGVSVGVDKNKGVDVGVTVGGKKIGVGSGSSGFKLNIPFWK